MLRRRTRKKEGWDDEVETPNGRFGRMRDTLRRSDKLWVAIFIFVMLAGMSLLIGSIRHESRYKVEMAQPPHIETGPYRDAKHNAFVGDLTRGIKTKAGRIRARFLNAGAFEIIFPPDATNEDVSYVSRTVAYAILRRFHNSPLVYAYIESEESPDGREHIATTEWVKPRNGFEVRYREPSIEEVRGDTGSYTPP